MVLPDASALPVGGAGQGEAFTARAVFAEPREADPPAPAGTQPEVVDPHLAACGVAAPPIAFPDAEAIVTQWEKTYADLPVDPAPSPHAEGADPSTPHTIEISVDEHQFTVGLLQEDLGMDDFPALPLVWGLTATSTQVSTGVASGSVRVTCIGLDAAPDVVDPAWEDVVELSLATTPDWPLAAAGGWSVDEPCDRLDEHGPGTYRVRVHARGRDTDYDGVAFEPVEDYLVLAWPAPSSAPVGPACDERGRPDGDEPELMRRAAQDAGRTGPLAYPDEVTTAVCPGSFDPLTLGHVDVVRRASTLFDEVVVGVARNSSKASLLPVEERVALARAALADVPGVRVEAVDGLLADFVRTVGAVAVVKGLRGGADFDAELPMALMNRHLSGVETVFVVGDQALAHIASSLVKDVARYGGPIDDLVPAGVADAVRDAVRTALRGGDAG